MTKPNNTTLPNQNQRERERERERKAGMENLPGDLCCRILSLLDHRHLASISLVCRSWNYLSKQSDLWENLYMKRWADENIETHCPNFQDSWKATYESRDRCDRLGLGTMVTREGSDYLLVSKGRIVRILGSCKRKSRLEHEDSQNFHCKRVKSTCIFDSDRLTGSANECNLQDQGSSMVDQDGNTNSPHGSSVSLFDRIIYILGDLDAAMRSTRKSPSI